jgi:hypothetical protein
MQGTGRILVATAEGAREQSTMNETEQRRDRGDVLGQLIDADLESQLGPAHERRAAIDQRIDRALAELGRRVILESLAR